MDMKKIQQSAMHFIVESFKLSQNLLSFLDENFTFERKLVNLVVLYDNLVPKVLCVGVNTSSKFKS